MVEATELLEAAAPYGAGGLMLAAMVVLRGILRDRDETLGEALSDLANAVRELGARD